MIFFVDTSAFIALTLAADAYHLPATRFVNEMTPQMRLLTSNFIFAETLTYLNRRSGAESAYVFGDRLLQSSLFEIIEIDPSMFHEAMKLLKKFGDKNLSFTDLTSFVLMRSCKVKKAFTFDSDFVKAGFETVPNVT